MTRNLFVRIAANELGAVEECLDRFGDLVWSITRQYLFDRSEKDELVQEIFIEIWRHANRFDEQVASEAIFVMMIARRRLIDFRRKLQRSIPTIPISQDVQQDTPSVEKALFLNEDSEWAREQLSLMPSIERKVIEMAIDDGLSHAQIADRLDRPLGTVKTIARRGLRRLRDLISNSSARHA